MSFQIVRLDLVSLLGERRSLAFRTDSLNVITGNSLTGKSTIVDIVDYCLGSRGCAIAAGKVRESLDWVGLLLTTADDRLYVARRVPKGKQASTEEIWISPRPPGDGEFSSLSGNTNRATLRAQLERFAGFSENDALGRTSDERAISVGIRHALGLIVQSQSVIANRDQLFYGDDDTYSHRALQEALPYFLGARGPSELAARRRLAQAERNFQAARSALDGAHQRRQDALEPGRMLARELGHDVSDDAGLTELLALLDQERSGEAADSPFLGTEVADQYESLLTRQAEIRAEVRAIDGRVRNLQQLGRDASPYTEALSDRKVRLESINLLPDIPESPRCVVCGQDLDSYSELTSRIEMEVSQLSTRLASVARSAPAVDEALRELQVRRSALVDELHDATRSVVELAGTLESLEDHRDIVMRRVDLLARLEVTLSGSEESSELELLREKALAAEAEIDAATAVLEAAEDDDSAAHALSLISAHMSQMARGLELEHSEAPVRLDPRRLTVIVDTEEGPRTLAQIGSAANWVGYHLVASLALARRFSADESPAPRFLLIDQLSLPFFPPEADVAEPSVDEQAVASMIQLLKSVAEAPEAPFQVVLLEHADWREPWFDDAVVERWRGDDEGLVPSAWFDRSE